MKRIILGAVVVALMASSAAYAAPMSHFPDHGHHVIVKKPQLPMWRKGQRFDRHQHATTVNDYQRYHLRRPGAGQHWVRVNNQYLLVGITSGIIGAILNAN